MFSNFNEQYQYDSSLERLQLRLKNIQTLMHCAIQNANFIHPSTKLLVNSNKQGKRFENGYKAKESLIRTGKLINELHEFIKDEFIAYGIDEELISPRRKEAKGEIKIAGKFKTKKQDVCIVPSHIEDKEEILNEGIYKGTNTISKYGTYKEERILTVNIRSQLSSVSKNSDTLFERMIAEGLNLHLQYPKMVTGELYMIPAYEYKRKSMGQNKVEFDTKRTNLETYIRFFTALSNYDPKNIDEYYKYNQVGLLIVDFSKELPKIYETTQELIVDGLVSPNFHLELSDISPLNLCHRLLSEYKILYDYEKIEARKKRRLIKSREIKRKQIKIRKN